MSLLAQEIQKGDAAADALKELKNKANGEAEQTMRKRLRERLNQGKDAVQRSEYWQLPVV